MKGCFRPARNAAQSKVWLENRLYKFWLQRAPPEIREVGELWGRGQIKIYLEGEEWRGKIRKCKFSDSSVNPSLPNTVTIAVCLYWFAHKKVNHWKDVYSITRTSIEWDRILHPYKVELTLTKVQQTKVKPRRLYFETPTGETGYFSIRSDPENISWKRNRIVEPPQVIPAF